MKLFEFFDYTYYRLSTWYIKREKEQPIYIGASGLVALSQVAIIIDILGFIVLESFTIAESKPVIDKYIWYFVAILLIIPFVNDLHFKNKFPIYKEKWKNIDKKKKDLYDILIFLLLFGSISFIPILLSVFDYTK